MEFELNLRLGFGIGLFVFPIAKRYHCCIHRMGCPPIAFASLIFPSGPTTTSIFTTLTMADALSKLSFGRIVKCDFKALRILWRSVFLELTPTDFR